MKVTARQLNRATLQRQLLLAREDVGPAEAVRRVVALQAQHPASPYIALWNRVANFEASALDEAFAQQVVVKATLMRITLHAVHVDDYPVMHAAMQPTLRAARLNDKRFKVSGLTSADADALMPHVAKYTRTPRLNADMEAWLTEQHGVQGKAVWFGIRQVAPLWHATSGPPWSFGPRPLYAAARTRLAGAPEDCVPTMVRRYLEGFGPATVADIAQFSTIYRPPVRAALEALGDEVVRLEGPAGETLFDLAGLALPEADVEAPPRLLPMWDSVLLAHTGRTRLIPEEYRKVVIRNNGDVLPTLLVDGYVAGVWRPVEGGIEATAFQRLPRKAWDGLGEEAAGLVEFLADREPTVYSRYGRWWDALPAAEVRVLPG